MKKYFYISALLFIFLYTSCGRSKSNNISERHIPTIDIPTIDSLLTKQVQQKNIAGAVIRIQFGDTALYRKAFGYAWEFNYQGERLKNPVKMTPDYMFDLASLTKVFATTFGMMMLVDDGKVNLDAPIYKYLPECKVGAKKKITVRNLLTHSSGLYQWRPTYYHASNWKEQLDYICQQLPLKWPVGQGYHYSDLGFILLGDIIHRVTGSPLNKYLSKQLYQPLGLNHTMFNPKKKGFTKIAATSHGNPYERHMVYSDSFGYNVNVDPTSWDGWRHYTLHGEVSDGNAWYTTHGVSGHAGLFSTVDDLQKLVNLLMNNGKYHGRQIISSAVIDTFLTKDRFGNALGWSMDPDILNTHGAPKGTYGHLGFTGTSVVVVPKYNLSIILLTNRENVGLQPNGYYYDLDSVQQQIFNICMTLVNHSK